MASKEVLTVTKVQAAGGNFVQVPTALRRSGVSDGAIVTYQALLEVAWGPGAEYYKTEQALADTRGRSLRAIRDHLRELEAVGAIRVQRIGKRRANLITINDFSEIVGSDDRQISALHIGNGDRQESAVHIAGDRQISAAVTGRNLPLYREADNTKQIAPKQSDIPSSSSSVVQSFAEQEEQEQPDLAPLGGFPGREALAGFSGGPASEAVPGPEAGPESAWWHDGWWIDFEPGYMSDDEEALLRLLISQRARQIGRSEALAELATMWPFHERITSERHQAITDEIRTRVQSAMAGVS